MMTLIIGRESNLSIHISQKIDNGILVSSREILTNIGVLLKFKNKKLNIIFNNFQPATQLNNLDNSSKFIENAIGVTATVLDYFKESKINKIIYTSSSSVYGNNILCNENDELKPMNLHASLKVANEKLIEKYCIDNNVDYTIARIFNMYGGNDTFSVINKIINAYKNNQELTIVNNGNAIRDFIHIDDVVEIYSKLLNLKNIKIINIGTGDGSSIKNVLDFLKNHNKPIKTNNIFREELKNSTADIRVLSNILNKNEFISIEEYLRKEFNI